MDLARTAAVVATLFSASVLPGCSEPAKTVRGADHGGCRVESVADFSPGWSTAKSPKEAIVTWLGAKRSDLRASIRAYGSAATQDRAAIADQATLDALSSVDDVLAQNIAVQVEASGQQARLLGVDQGGRSVAITVSRSPSHEPSDWMVTGYNLDLGDQPCP